MTSDPKYILIAGAILAAGAAVVAAVIINDRPHAVAPVEVTAIPARRAVEVAPPVPDSMSRDGVYVAGRQIKTGTYTAPGGPFCYWARLKYTMYGTQLRLVSTYEPDRQVVAILAGDVFQTSSCGEWVTVR